MKLSSLFLLVTLSVFLTNCTKTDEVDPDVIDKLLGTYDVFEQCDKTLDWSYTIEIVKSTTSDADVIIKNFGDYKREVPATVSNDALLYDYAEPEFTLRGNGDILVDALTLYYVNTEKDFVLTCTANCTKQ
jgi:hypothetical protein